MEMDAGNSEADKIEYSPALSATPSTTTDRRKPRFAKPRFPVDTVSDRLREEIRVYKEERAQSDARLAYTDSKI